MPRPFLLAGCVGYLLLATLCFAQSRPANRPQPGTLEQAWQLAREHRYSEAAAAMRGIAPPADLQQRIQFFRLRASVESGLGQSAAAAADMQAAAKLAPQNLDLQVAASLALLQAQLDTQVNPVSTLQTLRSVALPPDKQLQARMRVAEILSRANLYGEAAKDFEEASRLAPDRADILFNLALARFRNGEWNAALASAEQAKALEDSGSVERLLGDIQEQRGEALAAVHNYQAAVALEPNVEEHRVALATELIRHQTFEAAIVVLEQATTLSPHSVRIKILLGLTYYLVDRSSDSVRTLLQATRLDLKDEIAARYLGEITLQDSATPDPDAVDQICLFADAHPANKSANAFCGGVLLRVAEETGVTARKPEILRRLHEAVRTGPQEALARCNLGHALEWSQQWQEARTQLENCVRLDPDSPEGHYRLARVYRRLGLVSLASRQTALQQEVAQRQSEESTRRANTVSRFLVLLEH